MVFYTNVLMWITNVKGHFKIKTFSAILANMERLTKSKKIKRHRKHGFLARMKTHDGRKMIKRRRDTGRANLAV